MDAYMTFLMAAVFTSLTTAIVALALFALITIAGATRHVLRQKK